MDTFRVRLNCVDSYQATPLEFDPRLPRSNGHLQSGERPKVPVIRVFGATETGQKVCAHIHGAFPYLYIPYTGALTIDDVEAYIHQLHLSIDHALAVSYRRNLYDGKTQFVAHITLVKGVPFFGYHVGYDLFLKVYTLNPIHTTRLADLLRQGAIMKRVFQPYESHMQYIAQWMCDYNLYGCAFIDCKAVKFRYPVPEYLDMTSTTHQWHDRSIAPSSISDRYSVPRQSHCSVEVDICVQDILDRDEIKSRPIHHDFVERKMEAMPDEKLVHSMAGLWRDETRRRKARMGILGSDTSSPFPPEVLVSVSADPRYSQPGGWIHEEEYREKMQSIAEDERNKSDGRKIDFDTFAKGNLFESHINTSLESVEDLYPENMARISTLQRQHGPESQNGLQTVKPEVDESRLVSFEENDFPYESDEELAREFGLARNMKGDEMDNPIESFTVEGAEAPLHESQSELAPAGLAQPDSDGYDARKESRDQGPTSSTELESLGIRGAGNYTHTEDDVFDIGADFASNITANQINGRPMKGEYYPKRRKILHDGFPNGVNSSKHRSETNGTIDQNHRLKETRALETTEDPKITKTLKLLGREDTPQVDRESSGQRMDRHTLSSSQELTRCAGNTRLSFPIVKDPQDPNTILKLSQRSTSPSKGSRKSRTKSVSFADSDEPSCSKPSQDEKSLVNPTRTSRPASSRVARCSSKLRRTFSIHNKRQLMCIASGPPSVAEVTIEMRLDKIPSVLYQDAFYSDEKDVPDRAREYAGREFRLESKTLTYLPEFDPAGLSSAGVGENPSVLLDKIAQEKAYEKRRRTCSYKTWEIEESPPTRLEVQKWEDDKSNYFADSVNASTIPEAMKGDLSQVEGATQKNRYGFKYSQKQKSTSVQHETQYMSIMSVEIHVQTRSNLLPNPDLDEICCVFWCIQSDDEDLEVNGVNEGTHVGILALSENGGLARKISQQANIEVEEETSELDLLNRMVDIVRGYDPDILTGYEVHCSSWGYMIERARNKYDYNLCDEFSRTISNSHGRFGKEDDRWGFNHTSTIRVTGRHMINIWRAMRGELNLLQYTMENVVFQLCHRRIPHYSSQDLTSWYTSDKPRDFSKVINYYLSRVQLNLEILERNELVPRTSEQARLLGVDFFSVFSRGSQFKVESLMFRIAKPENFLLPSPSRKQVGQQNALECLPLVMEPQSAFYNSPLLVLDFQSLYPSVMIAYNYCYSTFLGRVVNWRGQNKMGFTDYQRTPRLLELLQGQVNIAPNGIMYAKPELRKSLLAKMLGEILETRVMVKSGMKVDKDDKTLQRLLNNRQLALKLIANVTYGYTSASFSGRMPCSEIADSIVQTARETLEKAIALIHSVSRWDAEVVYGDTDSLFVYLKGRTKDEAFDIGEEIAKAITNMNPRPVKLKFEKVYFPSVLLAKKRYVGFKYESKSQETPEFDAKGIETVRRDGTPASQKIEEKALKILFRTADLSQVKSYFQRQCAKIMRGKVSIQDFCFAKEVKLGTYSDKGLPPPGALISTSRMLEDPRAEPQYGERVLYVVITGAPGARLIDRCVSPDVLLHSDNNDLDAEYYISKNLIPPLERIFNLIGANVRQWYDEMPKFQRMHRSDASLISGGKEMTISKKTLESYMKSSTCLVCGDKLEDELAICSRCISDVDVTTLVLQTRLDKAEKKAVNVDQVCRSCAGLAWGEEVRCDSKDCPVFYTRARHAASSRSTVLGTMPVIELLKNQDMQGLDW